ncbi:hypothetical protein [Actinoplanes palleronii]|uniref:Secreted protein n=1 Tax=Actinoplanes palleronii TaxID=113570 RepID=A0ABQ4BP23_9ACTN|nr:hypothetical protein [Actinoplanes palleronii]GIE72425.1 hypothetical protein Apa02nite_085330 [Actinoplanes palleronii]
MRRWIGTATLGLTLSLGMLAGCGGGQSDDGVASAGGGTGATPTASAAATDDPAKFAACLRDNGVDVKDPEPGTGQVTLPDGGAALDAALKKCQQYGSGAGGSTGADPDDPAQQENRRKFAACMRDEGVDWPDPVPGKPMSLPQQTPQFMAAFQKCTQKVPMDGSR